MAHGLSVKSKNFAHLIVDVGGDTAARETASQDRSKLQVLYVCIHPTCEENIRDVSRSTLSSS